MVVIYLLDFTTKSRISMYSSRTQIEGLFILILNQIKTKIMILILSIGFLKLKEYYN